MNTGYNSGLFLIETQNLQEEKIYLQTLRDRFSELSNKTNEEILTILSSDKDRSNYESEFELLPDMYSIEDSLLNIDTLLSKYPSVQGAINCAIEQAKGSQHIVIGYYSQKAEGWTPTVGPISTEPIQFITKEPNKIGLDDINQILLTIQISPNGFDDFGRLSYNTKPKLVETSTQTVMMPKGTTFEQEISEEEFYTNLNKLEVRYI